MRIVILTTDNREPHKDYANPVPHFGTAPAALLQGLALIPEVEVHVVSCIRRPVVAPEKIAPNIFFHSLVVPKFGWMKTMFQGCVRATRKKIHEIRPDLVHGQGTEADCSISAVFSGFPNVLTLHGNMRLVARVNGDRPFSYNWLAARLEGFVLPRTDGVVCITRYTQQAVASLARRTWVLPNAVDASFFDLTPAPVPATPPLGLCVGTICHRKNQNEFIRALDPLARDAKFQILFLGQVQKDAYGQEFLELVRARPWCRHDGFADRERLQRHMRAARFTVLPTLEDNCPMVVLEAMAAGLPVLVSNVGGVPDLIQDEVNGLLCDPHKPETFRTGVARLLGDPVLARQLVDKAKLAAQQRFHPRAVATHHLEIYQQVVAASQHPSRKNRTAAAV